MGSEMKAWTVVMVDRELELEFELGSGENGDRRVGC
jgi:hypothetical protein